MADSQRDLSHALHRIGRRAAARVLAHPVLRLTLGRWPEPDEVRLFRDGFTQTHSRIPPLLRSLAPVPAARSHLTRTMLLAWMEGSDQYRDLLRPGADPAGTALMGDPLQVWSGPPIAFLHLEKTAGSSFMHVLQSGFHPLQIDPDPHRTCPPHVQAPFTGRTPEDVRRHALIWGHYDLPSLLQLDPGRSVLTLFREPRQRILSLYYFWRATRLHDAESRRANFGPVAAQSRSLLAFLRSRERPIRDYIDNFYVRRLTGQYASASARDLVTTDPHGSATRAIEALDRLAFIGVSERMKETLQGLGALFGFDPPSEPPQVNVLREITTDPVSFRHVDREPMTAEIEEELDRLTRLDRFVYAEANKRLDALIDALRRKGQPGYSAAACCSRNAAAG